MSNISKELTADEIISQVSKGQRVHDITLVLLERYLSENNISVKCDSEDIKKHVEAYETFHNYVLMALEF